MERHILDQFKNKFLTMKEELMKDELAGEAVLGGDEAEQAQEERDRLLQVKLLGRRAFMLKKIDNALSRIEDETYGECRECGCDIGQARLEARPTADYCIFCKEEMEREENQTLYAKRSHTHGQELGGLHNVLPIVRDDANRVVAQTDDIYLGATSP